MSAKTARIEDIAYGGVKEGVGSHKMSKMLCKFYKKPFHDLELCYAKNPSGKCHCNGNKNECCVSKDDAVKKTGDQINEK